MPNALMMAFELATYGLVIGILYEKLPKSKMKIYTSLLIAMISGRLIWGVASMIIYGINQSAFTWQMFMAGALLNAIPGIAVQLVLIPAVMVALGKTKLIPFGMERTA